MSKFTKWYYLKVLSNCSIISNRWSHKGNTLLTYTTSARRYLQSHMCHSFIQYLKTFIARRYYTLSFVVSQLTSLTLLGLTFFENQRTEGEGGLVVRRNLKVNNSAKNYQFVNKFIRNIVLSIINPNSEKILACVNSVII